MLQELALAIGLDAACILYGIDIRIINNVTIKSQK